MARIVGVNILTGKRVDIALTYIFVLVELKQNRLGKKAGLKPERRVNDLNDAEIMKIRELIDGEYSVEGDQEEKYQ